MWHPFFTFTSGTAPAPSVTIENGATIMRASVTNGAVEALIASVAGLGGTMLAVLNGSTIMRANPVNGSGSMRSDAINQTAELL